MSSCPICEQPIPGNSEHCAVCGFPTALAIEGLRAARTPASETPETSRDGAAKPASVAPRPPPRPDAELTAALAAGLRERMEAVRPLGRDAPDVTNEMCEAALSEASGRVSEALEILRAAQSRLERQSRDAVRRRLEGARDRLGALERTGVKLAFAVPAAGEDEPESPEHLAATLRDLIEAERRLAKFESDWKGIQGLLAQIEALRNEAADLAVPIGEVPDQIREIRERLQGGPLEESDLDRLSEDAARTLMLLHEAVPASLEEELNRHATALNALPDEHDGRVAAAKIHEEATHQLRKGQLVEASQTVRDLRRAIAEIEHPSEAPAPSPRPRPEPAAAPDDAALALLLKKARSLASRVRTLPTDSPMALEAAAQIREATELLRGGHLPEADRTLTDLMRTLSRQQEGGT